MDLGYEYAYIIKTVLFTAFFLPLQPIIGLFAPIGLGLIFAVNKYKLFYRFHRPKFHTFLVSDILQWILSLGPIALALGQIYIFIWVDESQIRDELSIRILGWICLGIAGFLYVTPIKMIYLCFDEPVMPNWDFLQKKAIIPTDFDRLNPITKYQAIGEMEHYYADLEQKKGELSN